MNQQFHNNQQSLKVTKKQAGVSKLFDWSKNFTAHMFNIKLKEKSYKWTSKCYGLKYSGQKTDCPPPPSPPGQIRLNCSYLITEQFFARTM